MDNTTGYWVLAMAYVVGYTAVVSWRIALRALGARMR